MLLDSKAKKNLDIKSVCTGSKTNLSYKCDEFMFIYFNYMYVYIIYIYIYIYVYMIV